MKKKLVSMVLVGCLTAATFAGCGSSSSDSSSTDAASSEEASSEEASAGDPVQTLINNTDGTVKLTLWASETDPYQKVMKKLVKKFQDTYSDVDFDITIGAESEADAKDDVLNDVEEAADVYAFADDQLLDLQKAGALQEVSQTYTYNPSETDLSAAVDAASVDGKLYAYPMTASNGYFLYYDSSVFSEDDVTSWENLVAAAEKNKVQVGMDFSNGWYLYGFFQGAGLTLSLNDDGTNTCNWNATDTTPTGAQVAEAITNICSSKNVVNMADQDAMAAIADGKLKAYVSGTWDSKTVSDAFGDGYAAAKLPTFNVDGTDYQQASYAGYKFLGVNPYSKNVGWAMLLAEFLTNEDSEQAIYKATGEGPANSAANEAASSPALEALAAQSEYAQLQRVGNNYWDPAASLGESLASGEYDDVQDLLDTAVDGITQAAN